MRCKSAAPTCSACCTAGLFVAAPRACVCLGVWCRLQSYCGVVEKAVEELSESLTAAAASNQVVDMSAACSNLTLKAIGEAAFG